MSQEIRVDYKQTLMFPPSVEDWVSENHKPDHNTLWRFFRDNKKAIRKIFKQSVRVASEASIVGLVLHALDGTKIAAAASNRTTLSAKSLN